MRHYLRRRRESRLVVDEAEELLHGQAAEGYRRCGGRVPAWTLVNLLAHSSFDQFSLITTRGARARHGSWEEALGGLARELIRLELSGTEIRSLQRDVLVPLEVDLLGGRRAAPATPDQLTSLVHQALDEHRIGR
jgi:hypothetical protein